MKREVEVPDDEGTKKNVCCQSIIHFQLRGMKKQRMFFDSVFKFVFSSPPESLSKILKNWQPREICVRKIYKFRLKYQSKAIHN